MRDPGSTGPPTVMPEPTPPSRTAAARRVLIVDDSVTIRAALKLLLGREPGWEVAGTAADGEQALEKIRELRPDIVVMDYEMPVMNGLEAIRVLRTFSQVPVVVLSGHTPRASRAAMELLDAGASDVMDKTPDGPIHGIEALRRPLMDRLDALTNARAGGPGCRIDPAHLPPNTCTPYAGSARLMAVGASTGGPPALEAFLGALLPSMTAPVVIAQHMPATFTAALADRLNGQGHRPTHLAADGMELVAGHAYVAPGGQHTRVRQGLNKGFRLTVGPDPVDAPYRPSVDTLFTSAAQAAGADLVAAVLTGMGDDGLRGAGDVVAAGGKVVAQDAASCVVYGMPRAVIEADLATAALPPADLARCISQIALRAA